ncbi:MAG: hypothetical protein E6Q24_05580 [Chitinophagaceae bacterium]|nr:MAG: hypothetical protein E6Q24_05580 [Chitinophagaceae bacterium]
MKWVKMREKNLLAGGVQERFRFRKEKAKCFIEAEYPNAALLLFNHFADDNGTQKLALLHRKMTIIT